MTLVFCWLVLYKKKKKGCLNKANADVKKEERGKSMVNVTVCDRKQSAALLHFPLWAEILNQLHF